MEAVKEALEQSFEYLNHLLAYKYVKYQIAIVLKPRWGALKKKIESGEDRPHNCSLAHWKQLQDVLAQEATIDKTEWIYQNLCNAKECKLSWTIRWSQCRGKNGKCISFGKLVFYVYAHGQMDLRTFPTWWTLPVTTRTVTKLGRWQFVVLLLCEHLVMQGSIVMAFDLQLVGWMFI